jgi:hypothetical protein
MKPANICPRTVFYFFALPVICFFTSCDKEQDEPDAPDPSAAIIANWKLSKDSLSNINSFYFVEGGSQYYPTPGVYAGQSADYWDFRANGELHVHENGQTYHSTFQVVNNKLLVSGLTMFGDGTIAELTSTKATFFWNQTSPNGGLYHRTVYLVK